MDNKMFRPSNILTSLTNRHRFTPQQNTARLTVPPPCGVDRRELPASSSGAST